MSRELALNTANTITVGVNCATIIFIAGIQGILISWHWTESDSMAIESHLFHHAHLKPCDLATTSHSALLIEESVPPDLHRLPLYLVVRDADDRSALNGDRCKPIG
jgi:hypothetical protein